MKRKLPSPRQIAQKTPIVRDIHYLSTPRNLSEDDKKYAQKYLTKIIIWCLVIITILSIAGLMLFTSINNDVKPDKATQKELLQNPTETANPSHTKASAYPSVASSGSTYTVPDVSNKPYVDKTPISTHDGFTLYKAGEKKDSLISERLTRSLIQKYGDAMPSAASVAAFPIVGEDTANSAYLMFDPQKQFVFSIKETPDSVEDNYYTATTGAEQDYQRWVDIYKVSHEVVDILRDTPTGLISDKTQATNLDALQANTGTTVVMILDPNKTTVGDKKEALEVARKLAAQIKPRKDFDIEIRWATSSDEWVKTKAHKISKNEHPNVDETLRRLTPALQGDTITITATPKTVRTQ